MKLLTAAFFLILIFGFANAQKIKESTVPSQVVSAFHKMYPDVKKYQWYNEDGNYEAEYEVNEMEAAATFDKNGVLVETEKEIPVASLPPSIADYVSKNYSGSKIKEASEISDAKNVKTYEAEIKGKDLVFDVNGMFIKEEKD